MLARFGFGDNGSVSARRKGARINLSDIARAEAQGMSVWVLEGDAWDLALGVRILGATLWTEFDLWGAARRPAAMHEARRLADATLIAREGRPLSSADSRERCLLTLAWLEAELEKAAADDVAAVVLTRHAPHVLGLAPQHREQTNSLGPAFASDLARLMHGLFAPAIRVLGQTHWCADSVVGQTRLLSNQAGYSLRGEGLGFRCSG